MDSVEFKARIREAQKRLASSHKTYSKRQTLLKRYTVKQTIGRPTRLLEVKFEPLVYESMKCRKCGGTKRYMRSANCVTCRINSYSTTKVSRNNKEIAKLKGLKTYFNLRPCSICQQQERYVSTGQCAFCVRKRRHNRRAAEGSYTIEQWLELLAKLGHKCLRCGKSDKEERLSVDHVIPLSKGGTNYIENIQPLCLPCNKNKHDQHVDYRIVTN